MNLSMWVVLIILLLSFTVMMFSTAFMLYAHILIVTRYRFTIVKVNSIRFGNNNCPFPDATILPSPPPPAGMDVHMRIPVQWAKDVYVDATQHYLTDLESSSLKGICAAFAMALFLNINGYTTTSPALFPFVVKDI